MTLDLEQISDLTSHFIHTDLELLSRRTLQKRMDQKYILPQNRLNTLLQILVNEFVIIETPNHNLADYKTVYFDTQERTFFKDHLRGKRPRYKVRIRHYSDRQISMLECKKKTSANLTLKTRREIPFGTKTITDHPDLFSNFPYNINTLEESLTSTFRRITLLHRTREERLTIDFNIRFSFHQSEQNVENCVIIELKKSPQASRHHTDTLLRSVRAYPLSVSKYCIGGCYLFNSNKTPLYRSKIRMLRKVLHDRTI